MFKFFCYSLVDVDTQRIKCHARKHDDRTGLGPETFCLKFRKITIFSFVMKKGRFLLADKLKFIIFLTL